MIPETDPPIKRDDRTPSVLEQATSAGWEAGLYDFGKADIPGLTTYFNPGLVHRPDGLWLLVRRSDNVPGSPFGQNSIYAVKLDDAGRIPIHGVRLKWALEEDGQQFEDGRAFYVERLGQVGVSACTFKWHGQNSWTGAIQVLGFFDENWNCKILHYVPFETNATRLMNIPRERYQKNWLFWIRDSRLHLIYKSDPWTVATFGDSWHDRKVYENEGAKWEYGEIRGGTPPILVGDRYYSFFHSSMPWRGNYRRYHAGVVTFSAEPPYEVLEITQEPLLSGSQNDPWEMRKPPCIFPCGAVFNEGRFLITCGVNDLRAVWVEIPLTDVQKRLSPNGSVKPRAVNPEVGDFKRQVVESNARRKRGKRGKRMKQRTPEQQAAINARMAKARAARKTELASA